MIGDKKVPKKAAQPREIGNGQVIDTGMAMVLMGLLAYLFTRREMFLTAAIGLLLIAMVWPRFFKPVAKIWFGFSTIFGAMMTKIIMAAIFIGVICPVGVVRKLIGGDSLQLKKWKANRESVFTQRNHKYVNKDILRPY